MFRSFRIGTTPEVQGGMTYQLKTKREDLVMKKMICFVTGALLLTAGSVLAAESPSEELLPSPYFIDEVHCDGINVHDISESWLLSKDDVDAAKKVERKETSLAIPI